MSSNQVNSYESSTLGYIHILPVSGFFVVFDDKFIRKGIFKSLDDALTSAIKIQSKNRIPIILHKQNGDVDNVIALSKTRAITNGETSRIHKRSRPINQRSLSVFNV